MTMAEKIVILLNAGYDLAEIPRELDHQHTRDSIRHAIARIRDDMSGVVRREKGRETRSRAEAPQCR